MWGPAAWPSWLAGSDPCWEAERGVGGSQAEAADVDADGDAGADAVAVVVGYCPYDC